MAIENHTYFKNQVGVVDVVSSALLDLGIQDKEAWILYTCCHCGFA